LKRFSVLSNTIDCRWDLPPDLLLAPSNVVGRVIDGFDIMMRALFFG
jgi:hypothetical protein